MHPPWNPWNIQLSQGTGQGVSMTFNAASRLRSLEDRSAALGSRRCELPGMHSVPKSAVLPYASGVGGLSRRLLNNMYMYTMCMYTCISICIHTTCMYTYKNKHTLVLYTMTHNTIIEGLHIKNSCSGAAKLASAAGSASAAGPCFCRQTFVKAFPAYALLTKHG